MTTIASHNDVKRQHETSSQYVYDGARHTSDNVQYRRTGQDTCSATFDGIRQLSSSNGDVACVDIGDFRPTIIVNTTSDREIYVFIYL